MCPETRQETYLYGQVFCQFEKDENDSFEDSLIQNMKLISARSKSNDPVDLWR